MTSFRYCLNSSTIRPVPILEKIAIAAECGYAGIELWHDDIDAHLDAGGTLDQIRDAVDVAGLAVPTTIMVKGWCDTQGDAYSDGIAECRRRFSQAVAVGAPFTIAGPPHGAVDRALAIERYAALLDIGSEMGVRPAMEYLGFADDLNTIEDAMEVMNGHPDATIVLDPFHCFRGGGPIETIRQLKPDQIAMSHFNDAPDSPPREVQRDPDRVLPGDGVIDLGLYLRCLAEIGYGGWLSLEIFRRDLWERDPREVARVSLEKMRASVEAALA